MRSSRLKWELRIDLQDFMNQGLIIKKLTKSDTMNDHNSNSRRNFLKKAGGVSLGMAGITAMAGPVPAQIEEKKKAGSLFVNELV